MPGVLAGQLQAQQSCPLGVNTTHSFAPSLHIHPLVPSWTKFRNSSSTARIQAWCKHVTCRPASDSCCSVSHARSQTPSIAFRTATRPCLPGLYPHKKQQQKQRPGRGVIAKAVEGDLLPLGQDFLAFLSATVLVIPLFKRFKISPVLGFLFSGLVLQQFGFIHDSEDLKKLSELGVLFLLFEMGLELSFDRLKSLAKFAFGMGGLQIILCTAFFTAFSLPAGNGIGTQFLTTVAHAPSTLVSIRSVDEAIVIAAALSMSSSAFVLQLLQERGEMASKVGSATLGILLFQDIAVVPFLVLLPLLKNGGGAELIEGAASPASLVQMLGPTALEAIAGVGALLLADKYIFKWVFEVVAQSRNSEAFVALCLLTVAGASTITQQLGFSDTLGAFIAGVLLSETAYRTQVEADIRPFKGLLLGLFFVSTGGSINTSVLLAHWQEVFWILAGLLTVKTAVIAGLGRMFGLSRNESIRSGFLLSQGGEFAFVLLSLANQLQMLPEDLNQLLIIVVVLSMAVTPLLADLGKTVADKWDELDDDMKSDEQRLLEEENSSQGDHDKFKDAVVICGFSAAGQMVATMLDNPLASGAQQYVAFELDPARVAASRKAGFKVVYGDGSRPAVLKAAGVEKPKAIVVCYPDKDMALKAVHNNRADFPNVQVYACASDLKHAAELEEAGADSVVIRSVEAGLSLGAQLLDKLGTSVADVNYLNRSIQDFITLKAHELAERARAEGGNTAMSSIDVFTYNSDYTRQAVAADSDASSDVNLLTSTRPDVENADNKKRKSISKLRPGLERIASTVQSVDVVPTANGSQSSMTFDSNKSQHISSSQGHASPASHSNGSAGEHLTVKNGVNGAVKPSNSGTAVQTEVVMTSIDA